MRCLLFLYARDSFIIYHWIFKKKNTTGARTAFPPGTLDIMLQHGELTGKVQKLILFRLTLPDVHTRSMVYYCKRARPECSRQWVRSQFAASPLSTLYSRERAKTGWLGIKIMERYVYPRTVFHAVSQHYKNPSQHVGLVQSGRHHHHLIKM